MPDEHHIALRTAPAGLNGFGTIKWVNNKGLWYNPPRHTDRAFCKFGVERDDYARGAGISLERMQEKMKAGQDYRTERRLPSDRILRVDNRFRDKLTIATYTNVTKVRQHALLLETTQATMVQGLLVHDDKHIVASTNCSTCRLH